MPILIKYSEWKATASIDFITIRFPSARIRTLSDVDSLRWSGRGTLECPRALGRPNKYGCDWLTVHDPDRTALQSLIDQFPDQEILGLEFTIDLRPRGDLRSISELNRAHAWLLHALQPQRHRYMAGVTNRKFYDPASRRYKRFGLSLPTTKTTVLWENAAGFEQVRLYVKKDDTHVKPFPPSARLEVTFERGGCQRGGFPYLRSLPAFAPQLRRYVAPFFEVAKGIKPKISRSRSKAPGAHTAATIAGKTERQRVLDAWAQYGAGWAVLHGYKTIPDRDANRLIGGALNALRRDLMKLVAP